MRKKVLLLTITSLLLFSFSKKASNNSPEELAKYIFETIKNNKEDKFLDLLIKNEEFSKTIDASNMDKETAKEFKNQFINKLNKDREKIVNTLKKGFEKVQSDINIKSCKTTIQLGEIIHQVDTLINIPLEIGKLNIQYICSKDTQEVSVRVINTIKGWRVIEKLRLVK